MNLEPVEDGRRLLMKFASSSHHAWSGKIFVKVPNWQRLLKKKRVRKVCGKESRLRACKHIICRGVKSLVFKKYVESQAVVLGSSWLISYLDIFIELPSIGCFQLART